MSDTTRIDTDPAEMTLPESGEMGISDNMVLPDRIDPGADVDVTGAPRAMPVPFEVFKNDEQSMAKFNATEPTPEEEEEELITMPIPASIQNMSAPIVEEPPIQDEDPFEYQERIDTMTAELTRIYGAYNDWDAWSKGRNINLTMMENPEEAKMVYRTTGYLAARLKAQKIDADLSDNDTYEFWRDAIATQDFDGAGVGDDSAFDKQIASKATKYAHGKEFHNLLIAKAGVSSLLNRGGEHGFNKFLEEIGEHPGYDKALHANYLQAWNEITSDFDSRPREYRQVMNEILMGFQTIGEGEGLDRGEQANIQFDTLMRIDDEMFDMAVQDLLTYTATIPKPEAYSFWQAFSASFSRNVDAYATSMGQSFTQRALRSYELGDVDPMTFASDIPRARLPMTDEERKRREASTQEYNKYLNRRAIVKTAFENYDQIEGSSVGRWLGSALGTTATSLSMAVPYVGTAAMYASMEGQARQDLFMRGLQAGLSQEQSQNYANNVAPVVAVPQTALNKVQQLVAVRGKMPRGLQWVDRTMDKLDNAITNRVARYAGKVALVTAAETAIEIGEDLTQDVVMDLTNILNEEMPDVNWSEELSGAWNSAPDIAAEMIFLSLLGAAGGMNARKQHKAWRDTSELKRRAWGWTKETRERLDKAAEQAEKTGNFAEFGRELKEANKERDANSEEAQEAVEEFKKAQAKAAEFEEKMELANRQAENSDFPIFEYTNGAWSVIDRNTGEVIGSGMKREEAIKTAQDRYVWYEIKSANEIAELGSIMLAQEKATEGDETARAELDEFMTRSKAEQQYGKGAEERFGQQQEITEGRGQETKKDAVIKGMRVEQMKKDGKSVVTRIFGGGDIMTVFHEEAHVRLKQAMAPGGSLTEEGVVEFLQHIDKGLSTKQVGDKQVGLKLLPDNFNELEGEARATAIDEAVAELMEVMVLRTRKKGGVKGNMNAKDIEVGMVSAMANRNTALGRAATGIASMLRALRQFWGIQFYRLAQLNKAVKDGTVSEEKIDDFLNKLYGLDAQVDMEQRTEREAQEMAGETPEDPSLGYSISYDLPSVPPSGAFLNINKLDDDMISAIMPRVDDYIHGFVDENKHEEIKKLDAAIYTRRGKQLITTVKRKIFRGVPPTIAKHPLAKYIKNFKDYSYRGDKDYEVDLDLGNGVTFYIYGYRANSIKSVLQQLDELSLGIADAEYFDKPEGSDIDVESYAKEFAENVKRRPTIEIGDASESKSRAQREMDAQRKKWGKDQRSGLQYIAQQEGSVTKTFYPDTGRFVTTTLDVAPIAQHLLDSLPDDVLKTPNIYNARRQRAAANWQGNYISRNNSAVTYVHEVMHVATQKRIEDEIDYPIAKDSIIARERQQPTGAEYLKRIKEQAKSASPEMQELVRLYLLANKNFPQLTKQSRTTGDPMSAQATKEGLPYGLGYGLANMHEFVAQTFSSKPFQEALNQIPDPKAKGMTLWQSLINAVRKMFGLNAEQGSVLESVIAATAEIAEMEAKPEVGYSIANLEETYAPVTEEEVKAANKAESNKQKARSPILAVAAVRLANGEITVEDYADAVDVIDPFVSKGVETPPTEDEIREYISSSKQAKVGVEIEPGTPVEARIDIPTWNTSTAAGNSVYAVTLHKPVAKTAKQVGTPLSYMPMAHLKNVEMMTRAISGQGGAIRIAAGQNKTPLATVAGEVVSTSVIPEDISEYAEVSYNPIRSSGFRDVSNRRLVIGGEEAVSIGSRVYVKNPEYGQEPTGFIDPSTPEVDISYSLAPAEFDGETLETAADVKAFITDNFTDAFKAIGTNFMVRNIGYPALFNVSIQGEQVFFNAAELAGKTTDEIDMTVREEMIHAVSYKVLKAKGINYDEYHRDLYKQMRKDGILKDFRKVYRSAADPVQIAAEYKRAAVQMILYGQVTEQMARPKSFQMIRDLLADVVDFFKQKVTSLPATSKAKQVFDETVKMMRRAERGHKLSFSIAQEGGWIPPEGSPYPAASQPALENLESRVRVDGEWMQFGPFEPARKAAEDYMNEAGLPYNPPRTYAKVDKERATRIADEFQRMEHAPQDPEVAEAYQAMIDETMAQYEFIKKTGLKIEPVPPGQPDPYGNPRNAILDVVENNHLWFFTTLAGFGGESSMDVDISGNPLLAETGEVINGHPMVVNDVFRVVHDYFGHIKEGVGFRANGEENAWRSHSAMYTPLARRAMTTETRGQNSWVNFGPFAEKNKTAGGAETEYAPQKIGLLPEWVMTEGAADSDIEVSFSISKAAELARESESKAKVAEEEFFKDFWPKLLKLAGQNLKASTRNINKAADRAVADIADWIRENPKYLDYYNNDWRATREILEEAFPDFTEEHFIAFRLFTGLTSPSTPLDGNLVDAVQTINLLRNEGSIKSLTLATSPKGNLMAGPGPFKLRANTGATKIRSLHIVEGLMKEHGGWIEAVEFLKAGVTVSELHAFNKKMGYKGQVSGIGNIRRVVKEATGQDTLIPRMFIFGQKVGAYTLNTLGDHRYTTTDIWESRFIRSYFPSMFKTSIGLPVNESEHTIFQKFATAFNKRFESEFGVKLENSALQAARWFYMLSKAREAGYKYARTSETISTYTERAVSQYIRRPGDAGGRPGSPGRDSADQTAAAQQDELGYSISQEMDADYMAVVEAGDMEAAQDMVDQAAKSAGYDLGPLFHGSPQADKFSIFDPQKGKNSFGGINRIANWFTTSKQQAEGFAQYYDVRPDQTLKTSEGQVYSAYVKAENVWNPKTFKELWRVVSGRMGGKTIQDATSEDVEMIREYLRNSNIDAIKITETKRDESFGVPAGDYYAVLDPNQIKSADPVTYDDAGNVIPLSERFDTEQTDIRFQLGTDDMVVGLMDATRRRMLKSPEFKMAFFENLLKRLQAIQAFIETRGTAYNFDAFGKEFSGKFSDEKEGVLNALAMFEAIQKSLPPDLRGRLTGALTMAKQDTAEKQLEYLKGRVKSASGLVEKWMNREMNVQLKKLFKREKVTKNVPGKKPGGKAGADIHDIFAILRQAEKWSQDEVDAHVNGRLDAADNAETIEAEAKMRMEANLVGLVGNWKNASVSRKIQAVVEATRAFEAGYATYKLKKLMEREDREIMRKELKRATGKAGHGAERDAKMLKEQGMKAGGKNFLLDLLSFEDLLGYIFGRNSAIVKKFVDLERKASQKKADFIQARAEGLEALFNKLAGGKLQGEKLRYKLGSVKSIESQGRKLTEFEALSATMMWMQEDGRRHMIGPKDDDGKPTGEWNYDEDFIAEIEAQLSDEAKAVRAHLLDVYGSEYEQINPTFRDINGINMPQNALYSPITVKPMQAGKGEMTDPTTGMSMSTASLTPGSLRTRGVSIAEPEFRDVVQTFLSHTQQIGHWLAYAPMMKDLSPVMRHRDVINSVESKAGQQGVRVLSKWEQYFTAGGIVDASAYSTIQGLLNRMLGRAAGAVLIGRLSVIIIQTTQLGAAIAEMPVGSYIYRFSKLFSPQGMKMWREAFKSSYIQRRLNEMPVVVREAMKGLEASKPSTFKYLVRKAGEAIGGMDALMTAGTYAIVYDYQLKMAKQNGMTGAEAERWAKNEAERSVERVAQPTRAGTRSIFENTATNPFVRVGWAFASEGRQKLALGLYRTFSKQTSMGEKGRALALMFLINGALGTLMRTAWRDMKDGEDDEVFDERYWDPKRLMLATLTEPLGGMPFVGDAIESGIYATAGEWSPEGNMLSSIPQAMEATWNLKDFGERDAMKNLKEVEKILGGLALSNDTLSAASSVSHLVTDIAKLIEAALED